MKEHFVEEARTLADNLEGLPRDRLLQQLEALRHIMHSNIGKVITYDVTNDYQDRHYDRSAFVAMKECERKIMAALRGEQVSETSYEEMIAEEINHENQVHFEEKREHADALSTLEHNAMEMIAEGHAAFVLLKEGKTQEAMFELKRFCETEQYLFERIVSKQMQPDDGGAIDIYAYILASYYHMFLYFFSQSFLKRDVFMKYLGVRDKHKIQKKTSVVAVKEEDAEFLQKTYKLVKEILPYSKNRTDLNSVHYLHGVHELLSRWYALLQDASTRDLALSYLRVQDRPCITLEGEGAVEMRNKILTSYQLSWIWHEAPDYASMINTKRTRYSHVAKR